MRVPSLASHCGLKIWCCCELGCRLAAVALIWPLAWELPYAAGAALKRQMDRQTEERKEGGRKETNTEKIVHWLETTLDGIMQKSKEMSWPLKSKPCTECGPQLHHANAWQHSHCYQENGWVCSNASSHTRRGRSTARVFVKTKTFRWWQRDYLQDQHMSHPVKTPNS